VVDTCGTHGLTCRKSAGRLARHNTINHVIHRALLAAQIPSRLEPVKLCQSDEILEKWSDDKTVFVF